MLPNTRENSMAKKGGGKQDKGADFGDFDWSGDKDTFDLSALDEMLAYDLSALDGMFAAQDQIVDKLFQPIDKAMGKKRPRRVGTA
jgi:hypothetical protein